MKNLQVLWIKGLDYPKIPTYLSSPEKEALHHALVAAILEGIVRDASSNEYELIPVPKRNEGMELNILLRRGERKIFIICCSNYSPHQFNEDLERLDPSLVIFINHPTGISLKKIEQILTFTTGTLMEIHVPRILFPHPSVVDHSVSSRYTDFLFNGEGKYQELIRIDRILTPERREKIRNALNNWGPTIYEIVSFLNKILEAYLLGCRILNVW